MKRAIIVAAVVSAGLALPELASANLQYCGANVMRWPGANPVVVFKKIPASFGYTYNDIHRRWEEAALGWNSLRQSTFAFNWENDNDNNFELEVATDGNEVAFQNVGPNSTALAITWVQWQTGSCAITETNMVFYNYQPQPGGGQSAIPWRFDKPGHITDGSSFPGTYFSVVSSHELGHALGMNHSWHGTSRMESHYPCGGWTPGDTSSYLHTIPHGLDAYEMTLMYNDPTDVPGLPNIFAANGQPNNGWVPDEGANTALLSWQPDLGDNTFPLCFGTGTNVARRGDTCMFRACLHNIGADPVDPITVAVSLTGSATHSGATGFSAPANHSFDNVWSYHSLCEDFSFVVPASTSFGIHNVKVSLNGAPDGRRVTYLNRIINVVP